MCLSYVVPESESSLGKGRRDWGAPSTRWRSCTHRQSRRTSHLQALPAPSTERAAQINTPQQAQPGTYMYDIRDNTLPTMLRIEDMTTLRHVFLNKISYPKETTFLAPSTARAGKTHNATRNAYNFTLPTVRMRVIAQGGVIYISNILVF